MFEKNGIKDNYKDERKKIITTTTKVNRKKGEIVESITKETINVDNSKTIKKDEGQNIKEGTIIKSTEINEISTEGISNERKIKKVKVLTIIYFAILLIALAIIVYILGISSDDTTQKDQTKSGISEFRTIFSTLTTLLFGSVSKSFHKALILVPYNFNEEDFKSFPENSSLKTTVDIFIDLFSGLAIVIYILKYFKTSNNFVIWGGLLVAVLLTILWIIAFKSQKPAK